MCDIFIFFFLIPQMCTARPGYESTSLFEGIYKRSMHKIDLSDFIDILDIDVKKGTVTVEPGVTCGQLSRALLAYGCTMEVSPFFFTQYA